VHQINKWQQQRNVEINSVGRKAVSESRKPASGRNNENKEMRVMKSINQCRNM